MIVFQQSPTITEGNRTTINTSDGDQLDVLNSVLAELRKMNIHMSSLSDMEIRNCDVEEE